MPSQTAPKENVTVFVLVMLCLTFFMIGASLSLIYTSSVIRDSTKMISEHTKVIREVEAICKK